MSNDKCTFCRESEAHSRAKGLTPNVTLSDFFLTYSKEEAKKKLWELLYHSFSSSEGTTWNSQTRSDYLFFYKKMDELIDLCYQEAQNPTDG